MMDYLSGLLKFASVGQRTAFIVGASSWLLLALPQDVTNVASIPDFRICAWLIAFVASAIFLLGMLYDITVWSFGKWKEKLEKRKYSTQKKKELSHKQAELHELSLEEKRVLRPFIKNGEKEYLLDEDIITLFLEEKNIIYHIDVPHLIRGGSKRIHNKLKKYYISDWAYCYLLKNPYLILENGED